jgi:hypothetical protein
MEEPTSHFEQKLLKKLQRSWPAIAAGAVLVIGVCGFSWWYAVSGKGRQANPQPTPSEVTEATSTTPTATTTARHLDGSPVLPGEEGLQAFAVMIDNHPDARPQSGLAEANLVYEIPVEGGMTRFMAVFDATTTAEQIGPVRSARKYFVEFADGLDAVYAHVGGSPEALQLTHALPGFRELDEFANSATFWRSKKRAAPHNVYTRIDLLREAAARKKWSTGSFVGWAYVDAAPTSTVTGQDVPDITYEAVPSITWKYVPATNSYERYASGAQKKDIDGAPVVAKNVVVLFTESSILDSYGRLKVRTTGKGQAMLYRDGKAIQMTWHRSAGEHLRFETMDSKEALFNPGTTWIQVLAGSEAPSAFLPSTSTTVPTATSTVE